MHVLKFTQGEDTGDRFLNETIGFGENITQIEQTVFFYETIGFRAIVPGTTEVSVYDTIGFGDGPIILSYDIYCFDTIGFNDTADEALNVFCYDTIGFNDDVSHELDWLDVTCIETIGFNDGGQNEIYDEHDITFTWRTRTNSYPSYGYGGAEYGNLVSYGDGDAAGLDEFEIHIWRVGGPDSNRWLNSNPAGEFDDRLTVQSITINDTDDPDADASYTLTIANNISWNGGTFLPDVEVEVFVKDTSGVYSFAKIIITETLIVDHEG